MTVATYARVAAAWREMKRRHFPSIEVLHAADLRPTDLQIAALDRFFREQLFSRFGAVVRENAVMEFTVLDAMAATVAQRIETLIAFMGFRQLAVVFEAGDAWTTKVNAMFGPLALYEDGVEIPIDKHFLPKSAAEPGLEIADFVTHAVGGVGRTQNLKRKDFVSVFRSGPKERSSFMLVQSARRAPTATGTGR